MSGPCQNAVNEKNLTFQTKSLIQCVYTHQINDSLMANYSSLHVSVKIKICNAIKCFSAINDPIYTTFQQTPVII